MAATGEQRDHALLHHLIRVLSVSSCQITADMEAPQTLIVVELQ